MNFVEFKVVNNNREEFFWAAIKIIARLSIPHIDHATQSQLLESFFGSNIDWNCRESQTAFSVFSILLLIKDIDIF